MKRIRIDYMEFPSHFEANDWLKVNLYVNPLNVTEFQDQDGTWRIKLWYKEEVVI